MTIIEVIVLAIVQALTEFLPVSSSGHLIITQDFMGIDRIIGVDVMLHFGTLVALVIYFRDDLIDMATDLVKKKQSKLAFLLIAGTVPAVIIGFFFNDIIENQLSSTIIVLVMLISVGVTMIYEKYIPSKPSLKIEQLSYRQIIRVGLWQCVAFIPGTSRSGITMIAGRLQGLDINRSARLSFLLGIPVIFGASMRILMGDTSRQYLANNMSTTLVGLVVSATLGYAAIALLLNIVRKYGLAPFGWYRIVLGVLLAILLLTK